MTRRSTGVVAHDCVRLNDRPDVYQMVLAAWTLSTLALSAYPTYVYSVPILPVITVNVRDVRTRCLYALYSLEEIEVEIHGLLADRAQLRYGLPQNLTPCFSRRSG